MDPTELHEPIGPGVPTAPVAPSLPARTTVPSPQADVGTLDWLRTHRLPTPSMLGALDPQGPGSQMYQPTGQLLAHQRDPAYFTDTPDDLFTPPARAIELAKPGEQVRPGQLSLDLIDPWTSINEFGRNMLGNAAPNSGDAIANFLSTRDVDFLGWNIGSRIMDYPLAFLDVGWRKLTGAPMNEPESSDPKFFRFQTTQGYWDWVVTATDDQMAQQASQYANAYGGGYASAMYDGVLEQMKRDKAERLGVSSGDTRIDFLATVDLLSKFGGVADEELETETDRFLDIAHQNGWEIDRDIVHRFMEDGWAGAPYGILERLDLAGRMLMSTALPVVGTELARGGIDPTKDPFMSTFWQWSHPGQRATEFGQTAISLMAVDFIETAALAAVASPLAAVGAGARAGSLANNVFRAYDLTLKAGKIAMATGISSAVANWALEAAFPVYREEFGQFVDASRPISDSPLAGIANAIGAFSTGSWGIIPAYQVGKRGAAAALIAAEGRVGRQLVPRLGDLEPAIVRLGFGSGGTIGRVWQELGLPEQGRTNTIKRTFLSYMMNAEARDRLARYEAALRGERSGWHELDRLTSLDDRMAWIRNDVLDLDMHMQPMAEVMVRLWNNGRRQLGLGEWSIRNRRAGTGGIFDDQAIQHNKASQAIHRVMDDTTARAYLNDYDFAFGAGVNDIRAAALARLERYYQALPEMKGKAPPVDLLDKRFKRSRESWRQFASSVHGALYDIRNSQLYKFVREPTMEEAERLHLIRTDSLTQQDVTDDVLDMLRGGGDEAQQLMTQLRTKAEVSSFLVKNNLPHPTPTQMADMLEQMRNALPSRRINVTDESLPTYSEPLNAFQRELEQEGFWTLGFKPYIEDAAPRPLFYEEIFDFPVPGVERFAYTDPSQVPASEGEYRRALVGEKFRKGFRRYKHTWDDGVYVNTVPGEVPGASIGKPGMDPSAPHVKGYAPSNQWTYQEDTLAREAGYMDHEGNLVFPPNSLALEDTGVHVYGNRPGSQWPILRIKTTGQEYIFKSGRPTAATPLGVDMPPAAREAGVAATKMYNFLGLRTSIEMHYSWNGLDGTLQPRYKLTALDPRDLNTWDRYLVQDLQQHDMVDWWLGQHDTNDSSVFIDGTGELVAVDKGQAFKFYNEGDWPPNWYYTPKTAAGNPQNPSAHKFLSDFAESGGQLDRWAIEETLQKIEAIPENVLREWARPVAEARVKDGLDLDLDIFPEKVLQRRRELRSWMNSLYEQKNGIAISAPGSPQAFRTTAHGTYKVEGSIDFVNGTPADVSDAHHAMRFAETNPVNEPDPSLVTRAGVVIEEPDGRIWMVEPTNHYGGYSMTWAKGEIDAGETPQMAAVRETFEESGFIVALKRHLIDVPNSTGGITRYYVAERRFGGPASAPKGKGLAFPESQRVWLVTADQGRPMIEKRIDPKTGDEVANTRDLAVLDAWLGGPSQSGANAPHTLVQAPDPTTPGMGGVEQKKRFVTYTPITLPDGRQVIFQSPWLDYPLEVASSLSMGNRSLLGAKMDSVFRTWRSWRITQMQKAGLYSSVTNRFADISLDQTQAFHEALVDLAREHHVSVQALGNVGYSPIGTPFALPLRAEIIKEAERIFGDVMVPLDGRNPIPTSKVDWRTIIVRSYRQAPKLNASAAFTSAFYTVPVAGWAAAMLGQVIWPLLKFQISPLFKAGEYAESMLFNLMRGVGVPDPMTTQLFINAGMPMSSPALTEEAGYEPYITSITGVGTLNSLSSPRGLQPGLGAFLQTHRESGIRVAARNTELRKGMPRYPAATPRGLNEYLDSFYLAGDARLFPPTYTSSTPEFLLPTKIDGDTGAKIISFDATERDRAVIKNLAAGGWFNQPITDMASAYRVATALRLFGQIGPADLDRIIAASPLVSAVKTDDFLKYIGLTPDSEFILPTNPTVGHVGILIERTDTGKTASGILADYRGQTAVGQEEFRMGMGNARYGSWGTFSTAYGETWLVLKKDKVLPRDTIVTNDRIGSHPSVYRNPESALALISPQGAFSTMRLRILNAMNNVEDGETLLDFFSHHANINASEPTEHAFFEGVRHDEVDAIVFSEQDALDQWNEWVNARPPEHPAHMIEARLATGDYQRDAWRYAMEKAGLLDRADELVEVPEPEDLTALMDLPPEQMPPHMLRQLNQQLRYRIERQTGATPRIEESYYSQAEQQLGFMRDELKGVYGQAADMQTEITGTTRQPDLARIRELEERIRGLESAMRDYRAFATDPSLGFNKVSEAKGSSTPEAMEWMRTLAELESRIAAAIQGGVVLRRTDNLVNDVMDLNRRPGTERLLPIKEGDQQAYEEGRFNVLKEYMQAEDVRPEAGASTFNIMDQLNGATSGSIGTEAMFAPAAFRDRIRTMATNELGYDPGEPVVRMYLRGTTAGITSGANAGDVELLIVVRSPDNKTLGLDLQKIREAWMDTALPKLGLLESHPTVYSGKAHTVYTAWDQAQNGILMHRSSTGTPPTSLSRTTDPDGVEAIMSNESTIPVEFVDHFSPGGRSWATVTDGNLPSELFSAENSIARRLNPDEPVWKVHYTVPGYSTGIEWSYTYNTDSHLVTIDDGGGWGKRPWAFRKMLIRDIISRLRDKPYKVIYSAKEANEWESVLAAMWYAGELPPNLVFSDSGINVFDQAKAQQHFGASSKLTGKRTPDLEAMPGTPEHTFQMLNEQLAETLGKSLDEVDPLITPPNRRSPKAALAQLLSDIWNPVPWKEMRQTELAIKLASPIFTGVLRESQPTAYRLLHTELQIPDDDILTFLLEDNRLLNRWIGSGQRQHFEELVNHANKYTGGDPAAYRAQMDELRMSPEYDTLVAMWHLTLKAAQDEAFGVHFYNPYRSTLERSLNHPVFGVYPLSWGLKAAREWARFLFDNRVLGNGNLRLGMAPALAMSEVSRRMAIMWAKQDNGEGSLGDFLGTGGPLGSALMAFSLVMPGDWSSIPFPMSRAIRDMIRPNFNMGSTLEAYLSAGVGRDLELLSEAGGEAADIARNAVMGRPVPEVKAPTTIPPSIPGQWTAPVPESEPATTIPERYRRWD